MTKEFDVRGGTPNASGPKWTHSEKPIKFYGVKNNFPDPHVTGRRQWAREGTKLAVPTKLYHEQAEKYQKIYGLSKN